MLKNKEFCGKKHIFFTNLEALNKTLFYTQIWCYFSKNTRIYEINLLKKTDIIKINAIERKIGQG